MRRELRLRRSADFTAVHRRGRPVASGLLAMRCLNTAAPVSRIGFSVSKRVGNAVVRNRVKRRLRAAATSLSIGPGWDIVVSARPVAATRDYAALREALFSVLQRAQLLIRSGSGEAEDLRKQQ